MRVLLVEDDPALADVDLTIPPGQTVALVGSTGAGKSTFAKLVARFYDPTDGVVLLGGRDARTLRLADVHAATALVTQRPILFSESLRDNLLTGRPDAPWEDVEAACRALTGIAEP